MDWLFETKGKSVTESAQKVVADMHKELDKQNKKITELEKTIFKFKNMCTESLERDIARLEQRKKDLIAELEATDDAILLAQERLRATNEEVANVLLPYNGVNTKQSRPSNLDENYMEEAEMLAHIRTLGDVLFIIHLNATDDIVVYTVNEDPNELVTAFKVTHLNPIRTTELTPYEKHMVRS